MSQLNPDFIAWQKHAQAQMEELLNRLLPDGNRLPETLHQAMRYAALDGGKRLRPLLVLAASQVGQVDETALEAAMVAVECIHVYSLVHDDMPEMDNDSLRRGKPTCHIQYNQATALLVGDALQTLAFDLLSRPSGLSAVRQLRMVNVLARASGSLGMAGGQAVDLANVGKAMSQSELEYMHRLKTGALIRAAVALGGLSCADVSDDGLSALDQYADKLGLAFQVIDDVLDCEQDSATLGKTAGKDMAANKPTYVQLMGLNTARDYANQLVAEAISALLPLGSAAGCLKDLALYAVRRSY